MANENEEPEEIGKPHPVGDHAPDTKRERSGGKDAGEREDRRSGVSRDEDVDPSELSKGEGRDERPSR